MNSERIYSKDEESLQFERQHPIEAEVQDSEADEYESFHTLEEDKEVRFQKLLEVGEKKGTVTSKDVIGIFPEVEQEEEPNLDLMHEIFIRLNDAGIDYEGQVDETEPIGKKLGLTKKRPEDDLSNIDVDDSIGLYLKGVGRVPLLTAEQEVELAKRIERGREAREEMVRGTPNPQKIAKLRPLSEDGWAAGEHLINANSRLVISVAKKYRGRGVPFLDLNQEGHVGLIRAVKKFDYHRGLKFSTYATWWIRQAVTRAIADQGRTIRLPVHMGEQINRLLRTTPKLTQLLGRDPTDEELAVALNVTPEKVKDMKQVAQRPISLETPTGPEEDTELVDFIEDESSPKPVETVGVSSLREQIRDELQTLPPREARVLELRYGLKDGQPHYLEEIGLKLGVTKERVRQIEAEALSRLRHPKVRHRLADYLRE